MLINKSTTPTFNREAVFLVYSETFPLENEIGSDKRVREINANNSSDDVARTTSLTDSYPYFSQPLVLITSFLNLPNLKRNSDRLSFLDILKNMIDWDSIDEKNRRFSMLDKALAIPMFIYHVFGMLIKLPINILKLFTEFLPGLGEEACRIARDNAKKGSFKHYAANIGHSLFSCIHFIGRAITSPVKGWLSAYMNRSKAMGVISLITSCVAWGTILTISLGLAAIPTTGTFAFSVIDLIQGISFCGMAAFPFIIAGAIASKEKESNRGIIKPLLRGIFARSRKENVVILDMTSRTPMTTLKVHNQFEETSTNGYQFTQNRKVVEKPQTQMPDKSADLLTLKQLPAIVSEERRTLSVS